MKRMFRFMLFLVSPRVKVLAAENIETMEDVITKEYVMSKAIEAFS
ncbi:MAG: hypothetical protein J6C07_09825 [Lachnospiraceae bacterium]|nr:hypothetical protein [Lachnospiraceae bacterium]